MGSTYLRDLRKVRVQLEEELDKFGYKDRDLIIYRTIKASQINWDSIAVFSEKRVPVGSKHMLLATAGFSRWARSSAWIERVASDHQAVGSNPSGPVFNVMPIRRLERVCQLKFKSLFFNTPCL
jgi:hypothetical protein